MNRFGFALKGVLVVSVVACSSTSTLTAATPAVTPSPSPTPAKPSFTQEPLAPPTYVRFAVDRGIDPSRPYFLDLFYDGVATNVRVLDASGQVALRVPIAGSGIFGPETCAVRARPPGKTEGHTYISVDAETVQRLTADASVYRVEADSVGGRTVTVPLTDSGCRAD
jgi:hypothetical protein